MTEVKGDEVVQEVGTGFEKYDWRWENEGFEGVSAVYKKGLYGLKKGLGIWLDGEKERWEEGIWCGVKGFGDLEVKDDKGEMKGECGGDIDGGVED